MLAFCVHLAWLFCLRWGQISVGAHCCSFGCWRLIRAFVVVSWNVLTTLLCFNSWYFFFNFYSFVFTKKYDKIKQKPSFLNFWKVFQQKHIFFQYYHSLNLTKKITNFALIHKTVTCFRIQIRISFTGALQRRSRSSTSS